MATSLPETAPLIEAAVKAEPELLQVESCFSFSARLQRLVYEPFKAAAAQASVAIGPLSEPYLIIIDGLDECDDKEGVQEFIAATLRFFDRNPSVALRIFITSRVEQHIHSRLAADGGVRLKDLSAHCTREDMKAFMRSVFNAETKSNPIIQAHIQQNGSWPNRADAQKLVDRIGGSFVFASTLLKFIFQEPTSPDDHSTPLDRLPLALDIEPGLDGLYSQTLARSEHLPHFTEIISTLALLAKPLPISGVAELLDIQASAVDHVLLDLQAIVHVPGTDNAPITFYHTSLRDFLTTESQSGRFFAPLSFHARLLIGFLSCELKARRQAFGFYFRQQTAVVQYSVGGGYPTHWNRGSAMFTHNDLETLIQLLRETVELLPVGFKSNAFNNLGIALSSLFAYDRSTSTIEEAVSIHRKVLRSRPYLHPYRHYSLNDLGSALHSLFEHNQCVSHIEEAISMHREALSLRPHAHRLRHDSLNNLSIALYNRFDELGSIEDLDEAISLRREALEVPHPSRDNTLLALAQYLETRYHKAGSIVDLEEAISFLRELVVEHYLEGHDYRGWALKELRSLLQLRFEATGNQGDLEEAERLELGEEGEI
ncbi:hypothetical protein EST38_g10955 [Candolleomyces aberdarensis]|uniref:Nephrocystin 3-like N-terminal domain-containing protein n=1 Tax=Candolleomyces aberdarensis TaxID=2316362 RepID=A0A4Q2D646_9AGAR|nr:hypothetical protein EST38_g10955 [Candolleomyces aberdarensis]